MNCEAKRFLSIRLSQNEFDKVQQHFQQSACRSLTEYVKKVLTHQPVIIKVRDQSRAEILHDLGVIKSLLQRLPVSGANVDPDVLSIILELHFYFSEIVKKCSR